MSMKKSSLQKRYSKSFETKDSGSGGSVFAFPSETKFFKPKEQRNEIILVPYKVKTKKHPLVASGDMEIGDDDYVMDVWIHRSVGPGEVDIVCLKNNYHKACPCCEQAKEYRDAGDEKNYKALKASRRVAYNVLNARNLDAGVQIFITSHYLFEKELIDEASSTSKGRGVDIDFAGLENGKVIAFRGAMTKIDRTEYMEFKSFSFSDRSSDEQITEQDLKDAISLDEVMKVLTADEIKKIMYSGMGDDEEREEPASRRRPASEEPESDGSEEESPRGRGRGKEPAEEEAETPRRGRGRSDAEEPADEAPRGRGRGRDAEPEEEAPASRRGRGRDAEPEEEAPAPRRGKAREDDAEPEKADAKKSEPAELKTAKAPETTDACPEGYNYPDDWDKKKGCEKCKVWDRCNDAFDEKKKKEKA